VSANEPVAGRFEGSESDPYPNMVSQEYVVIASACRRAAIQQVRDRLDRHDRCAVTR
jgi:hypothetical protein